MTAINDCLADLIDAEALRSTHPSLFSAARVDLPRSTADRITSLIAAIESVIARPAYQAAVLARAPEIARHPVAARGVFFGYDVHLGADGPQLIEINTNAGGGLLNACLLAARGESASAQALAEAFVAMFRQEWQLARGAAPLTRIAIVDEAPATQYLAPEFLAFQRLFARHGLAAVIADPTEFTIAGGQLLCQGEPVDLVYNRLTDFAFATPACAALQTAYVADLAVITPHPRAHALYADKRNLVDLSDADWLDGIGVSEPVRATLAAGIPLTVAVDAAQADRFWQERRQWFFKPAAGFGSRATYRGDKLTRRVFEEILQGDYIAQRIAPPGELAVDVDGTPQTMKFDLRAYVYAGEVQLFAARLYQGQTTNFRTPGGGFAPVFIEEKA